MYEGTTVKMPELTIRAMTYQDISPIVDAEREQGWHPKAEKYERRLRDRDSGRSAALVAVLDGNVAGDINGYYTARSGPFAASGIPEIVDFGVFRKYQRQGIGSVLMDAAEAAAAERADRVCLGVGLHSGYGSAQRMYAKRGYIPDGSGIWYGDAPCVPYEKVDNDDDLVLYLSKRLEKAKNTI